MVKPKIIRSWLEGSAYSKGNMSTDGRILYSYSLKIGYKIGSSCLVIYDYTAKGVGISPTTSKHVNLALAYCDYLIHPHDGKIVWRRGEDNPMVRAAIIVGEELSECLLVAAEEY